MGSGRLRFQSSARREYVRSSSFPLRSRRGKPRHSCGAYSIFRQPCPSAISVSTNLSTTSVSDCTSNLVNAALVKRSILLACSWASSRSVAGGTVTVSGSAVSVPTMCSTI